MGIWSPSGGLLVGSFGGLIDKYPGKWSLAPYWHVDTAFGNGEGHMCIYIHKDGLAYATMSKSGMTCELVLGCHLSFEGLIETSRREQEQRIDTTELPPPPQALNISFACCP